MVKRSFFSFFCRFSKEIRNCKTNFRKNSARHHRFTKQFSEYEIINQLLHPNIIKTFGLFISDKSIPPKILLEFCQMNVETAIKEKRLSKEEIVFNIYQIVEGMKYIHYKNIIHRDLKPTNILIVFDGTIKICDFSISKLMNSKEQSMTSGIGTQKFMAPEILNEEESYDYKVDVYSFGVLLYFILSDGELPNIKLFDIPKGIKAPIPPNFTDFSKELINQCWNLDPNDRPSFIEILERMEENGYNLINLSKGQLKTVEGLILEHKTKITSY